MLPGQPFRAGVEQGKADHRAAHQADGDQARSARFRDDAEIRRARGVPSCARRMTRRDLTDLWRLTSALKHAFHAPVRRRCRPRRRRRRARRSRRPPSKGPWRPCAGACAAACAPWRRASRAARPRPGSRPRRATLAVFWPVSVSATCTSRPSRPPPSRVTSPCSESRPIVLETVGGLTRSKRREFAHRHRRRLQRLQRLLLAGKQPERVQPLAHARPVQPRRDEQGPADAFLECLGHEPVLGQDNRKTLRRLL